MISRWLAEQAAAPVPPPVASAGYTVDDHRVRLADDSECFGRARDALRSWIQFRLGWVDVVPPTPPIRVGVTVGVLVRHLGFWSVNASRIVSVIDESECFGFAYRTLADHAVDGDERFLVERTADGAVVYAVRARSRPRHVLAWLGYPFARLIQRRFARDSMRALAAAVAG
ncbi:MAG TPA: DUF1990 domain-containing protein [Candidatus Binatia bacterium]|nr:DUF1990 domain-containing protein [Candidatus Binatia bacterium]